MTPSTAPKQDDEPSRLYLSSLLLSNVRSLAPKIDELEYPALLLPNFFLFHNDREFSSGGGVCIYASCEISSTRLTMFENSNIESL